MPRGVPKKKAEVTAEVVEKEPLPPAEVPIEKMPLNTYSDYKAYNKRALKLNKELAQKHGEKKVYYPVKPCPVDLHPKQRVLFNRKDQPRNPLPVYLSTDMIDFHETLIPGKIYDLPISVLKFLNSSSTPIYEWFENPDGSKETRIASRDPRFALTSVYEDD